MQFLTSLLLATVSTIFYSAQALSLPADLVHARDDPAHAHHVHGSDARHAHNNKKLDHHGKVDVHHHTHAKRDASPETIVNERRASIDKFSFGKGLMKKPATELSNLENIITILTLQHDDILSNRDAMSKYGLLITPVHLGANPPIQLVTYAKWSRSTGFSVCAPCQRVH